LIGQDVRPASNGAAPRAVVDARGAAPVRDAPRGLRGAWAGWPWAGRPWALGTRPGALALPALLALHVDAAARVHEPVAQRHVLLAHAPLLPHAADVHPLPAAPLALAAARRGPLAAGTQALPLQPAAAGQSTHPLSHF